MPDTPVARPNRFVVTEDASGFSVSWSWRNLLSYFLAFSSLAMFIFFVPISIFFIFIAFTTPDWLLAIIGAILVFSPWVLILIPTIPMMLNKTTIKLQAGQLSIQYSPIWWPGMQTRSASSIEQLYITKKWWSTRNGKHYYWVLMARDFDQSCYSLVSDLRSFQEGKYLEQELEKRLNITASPVEGEATD